MELTLEKIKEENLSDKSIEYLFQPRTCFELLLRLDFEGMKKKAYQWLTDESPDAMPHRFRHEPWTEMNRAIQVEEFYRKIKAND